MKIQQKESVERGEENEMIIERILTLIKNVLQIAPGDNEIRADNGATSHDEVNLINNFSFAPPPLFIQFLHATTSLYFTMFAKQESISIASRYYEFL